MIITTSCNENKLCISYYPNKSIKEIYFENGKHEYNGLYKSFYMNGKIRNIGVSRNNTTIGIWHSYYSNGRINSRITYDDDGKVIVDDIRLQVPVDDV